jgi:FkbM family methyltransferase
MVMVDVGANIGCYSLLAARHLGPTGKVLAFEPGAGNVDLLTRSAVVNRFANIEDHPLAVAEKSGQVSFSMDDSNGGINRGTIGESAEWVRAVTLDDFLPADLRVDLVKIDIEGSEGLAIQGMRALLRRDRPVLFTEFTPGALPRFSGLSGEEYLDLLRQPGYQLRVIRHDGTLPAAPQSNAEIMRTFAEMHIDHIDLVAQPE